ncbi:MAG TPA: thymidylate kinase, partial [Candidatus Saccharimonadales bacterium]|nr:thymidylate kinase [Candidatus Saccharimonadales bacterium]
MADTGTFIVIEGSDGSGKGTQFRLLKERLAAVGYDVEVFDFPQYDQDSSHFVKQYLNGHYGPAGSISPYTASLFYALDRYEAAPRIRKALEQGKIVLCNRYVGSNMAHQGGKFDDEVEQRSFFVWEDSLEYQLLGIPRPRLNIFLKVPAETAQELVAKKKARQYTKQSHDEHEADLEHLKKSVATYDLLCELFPNDFTKIDCVEDGELLSIPDVNNKIWDVVKPLLPANPSGPAHSVVVKLNQDTKAAETKSAKKTEKPTEKSEFADKLSLFAYYEALQAGLGMGATSQAWHKNNFEYYKPDGLPKKTLARY